MLEQPSGHPVAQSSGHIDLAITGTDFLLTGDVQEHSVGPPASCRPFLIHFPQRTAEISPSVDLIVPLPFALGMKLHCYYHLQGPAYLCLFIGSPAHWLVLQPCCLLSAVLAFRVFPVPSLIFEGASSDFLGGSPYPLPRTLDSHVPQATLTCLFCLWVGPWAGH